MDGASLFFCGLFLGLVSGFVIGLGLMDFKPSRPAAKDEGGAS